MHELITRISERAGINNEQAELALDAVKDYVKEKFPMMAGAVDTLFAASPTSTSSDGDALGE